jgi:hypothetical protein
MWYYNIHMSKAKSPKVQEPAKVGKVTESFDKRDAEEQDGEPLKPKKEKKTLGIVAIKQKVVLDKLTKNIGKNRKNTMEKAMVDAGYKPSYAKSGHIKSGKTWNQLMEIHLSDDKLAQTHEELLNFKKLDYMLFNHDIKDKDIYELMESVNCIPKKIIHGIAGVHVWFWLPDGRIRKDATELAYKVRGKMAPEKFEVEQTGIRAMTDAELANHIRTLKSKFTKTD